MTNRVCELFGIRYPVVMGAVCRNADVGAAVSNAGGLGTIAGAQDNDGLRVQIERMRELTDQPFAVNVPIKRTPPEAIEDKVRLIAEAGVPAVTVSAGGPSVFTDLFKGKGIPVAHVVPTVYHAGKAVEAGVDAVIAEPAESGGYRGDVEVSAMVLVPSIRRAFPDLPLLLAGGVADGCGLAAAMALGADGVAPGTAFIATTESEFPEDYLKVILAADDTSTIVPADMPVKPRLARPELIQEVVGRDMMAQMGQSAALISRIRPAGEVVRSLVGDALVASQRASEALASLG